VRPCSKSASGTGPPFHPAFRALGYYRGTSLIRNTPLLGLQGYLAHKKHPPPKDRLSPCAGWNVEEKDECAALLEEGFRDWCAP